MVPPEASLGNAGQPPLGKRPELQHPEGRGGAGPGVGAGGLLIIIFVISWEDQCCFNNLGSKALLASFQIPSSLKFRNSRA